MTVDEFQRWIENHCAAFPDTAAWLNSSPNIKLTYDMWRKVFIAKRISLEAGKEATRAMLCGDVESPKAYDRDQTPAMIVRACRELKLQSGVVSRSEAELAANIEAAKRRRGAGGLRSGSGLRSVFAHVLGGQREMMDHVTAMRNAGSNSKEIDAYLDKAMNELIEQERSLVCRSNT